MDVVSMDRELKATRWDAAIGMLVGLLASLAIVGAFWLLSSP
jgi:hypothetical protein